MPFATKERKREWQREYNKKNRKRINESQKEWVKKNPDKRKAIQRRADFKAKYGITPEVYDKMLVSQKHLCAICLEHQSKFKLSFAVDHCHETGKVRALLCTNCNTALGLIKENHQTMQRVISYVMRHKL
jgi:hypothetical protein